MKEGKKTMRKVRLSTLIFVIMIAYMITQVVYASDDVNQSTGEGITWRWVVKPELENVYCMLTLNLFATKVDGNFGCIDKTGKVLSQPQWDGMKWFSSEGVIIAYREGKWYVLDKNCNIISQQWDTIEDFTNGLALAVKNDKIGYIDKSGKTISQPQWDGGFGFKNNYARVKKNKKWGYINQAGKVVISPQFDIASDFSEGLAAVRKDGKMGFINQSGKFVIQPQWDRVSDFSDGLALVGKGVKSGYIDKTGKLVIKMQWDQAAQSFSNNAAVVGVPDKSGVDRYGLINKNGKVITAPVYSYIDPFYDGVARVLYNGIYGYVNNMGNIISQPQWDNASNFSEGMALVARNKKLGYIDKTGKIIVQPQWDYGCNYLNGFVRVKKGGKYGYLDKTGKVISQPQWDFGGYFTEGYAPVSIDNTSRGTLWYGDIDGCYETASGGKWGLIDSTGKLVCPLQWDEVGYVNGGLAEVTYNGKCGVIQLIPSNIHYPSPLD